MGGLSRKTGFDCSGLVGLRRIAKVQAWRCRGNTFDLSTWASPSRGGSGAFQTPDDLVFYNTQPARVFACRDLFG